MAPELTEALREVAERAASVLAPETDLFEDLDAAGFGEALTQALRAALAHPVAPARSGSVAMPSRPSMSTRRTAASLLPPGIPTLRTTRSDWSISRSPGRPGRSSDRRSWRPTPAERR